MITIVSWMIFVPALIWNIILFIVVFGDIMNTNPKFSWKNKRNWRDLTLSILILFIPGVYLFGWL